MAWWRAVPGFIGGSRFYDLMGGPALTLTNMGTAGTTSGWATTARQGGIAELRFDGSDDQLATPANSAIFPSSFTMALWMKATAGFAGDYSLLWESVGGSGSLFVTPSGHLATYTGSALIDPGTATLAQQTWYHIALVVVGNTSVKLYVNCVPDGSTGSPGTLSPSAFSHTFGSKAPPASRFTGAMDDIKFYNRGLSQGEVCLVMRDSTRGEPTLLRSPLTALGLPDAAVPPSGTRLGLHVTQQELTIWRQRAQNGPYRVAGDISTNSPGNWTDMIAHKNTFNSNPAADHWTGQTASTCVTPNLNLPGQDPDDTVTLGQNLLHAAFYTLVANDTTTGANVRNELLSLAAEPGLDFSNASRWCKDGNTNDANPFFTIAIWANRILFAYDYLKAADQANGTTILSAGNKTTLDTWFQGMGGYWTWMGACGGGSSSGDQFFPDRTGENYATQNILTNNIGVLYYQGPTVIGHHATYNNRRTAEVHLLAMLGIVYNNATWNRCAKRWWKEWIRYGIWPDGSAQDLVRWQTGGFTDLGWAYASGVVMQMSAMAEAYARTSDVELMNYSTSEGVSGTQGGPKTLRLAVTALMKYADHTFARYATSNGADVGNGDYLIDFRSELLGRHSVNDTWFALANEYFALVDPATAAYIKSVYLRTATDQFSGGLIPGYPASPITNTYAWGGASGTWPAIPFMFGQMEGLVNPYPSITTPSPAPTSFFRFFPSP